MIPNFPLANPAIGSLDEIPKRGDRKHRNDGDEHRKQRLVGLLSHEHIRAPVLGHVYLIPSILPEVEHTVADLGAVPVLDLILDRPYSPEEQGRGLVRF